MFQCTADPLANSKRRVDRIISFNSWQDRSGSSLSSNTRKTRNDAPTRAGCLWFEYADKITDTKKKNINRESIQDNLRIWLSLWRDFYISASGSEMPLTFINFKSLSQKTAKKLTEPVVYQQLLQLENSLQQLDVNLNGRLLVETILMDWPIHGAIK